MSTKEPETTQAQRQALVEDLRVSLANAKYDAATVAKATGRAGLHTACSGWERLQADIEALLERARRMPK